MKPHMTVKATEDILIGQACAALWCRVALSVVLCTSAMNACGVVQVTDDLGVSLSLHRPAQRVVALAPHITELLFAVGAGASVVATVDHADYPAEARQIPSLGSHQSISVEALLRFAPDLVVAWHSGNGSVLINRLRDLGLKVYASEPRTLPDIAETLRRLGHLTGNDAMAQAEARQFLNTFEALASTYRHRAPLRVFYQVWHKPLTTLNGEHLISNVIRLCGGRNVFSDVVPLAPRVNIEAVIRANPEVIIASGDPDDPGDWKTAWLQWPTIDAVRRERLHIINPDLLQRHTPRVLRGASLL